MGQPAETSEPTSRSWCVSGVAVFICALAVRLIYLAHLQGGAFTRVLVGDGRQYDAWAKQIAAGEWLGTDVFYQAPLYPYFLGLAYWIIGHDLLFVRILQILLGAVACVLVCLTGRAFFGARAGLIAGLLWAFYAPAVFFDVLIQKTVLDVSLMIVLLALLGRFVQSPRRMTIVAAGATLGAVSLTRENALLLITLVVPWLLIHFRAESRRSWTWAAAFLIGMAVLLVPVAVRNQIVGGEFALTTSQLGPNFYIGNNPYTEGRYLPLRADRADARYERQDAVDIAEETMGRPLSSAEVSSFWMRQASEYIAGDPLGWLRLLGRKITLFWSAGEVVDTEGIEAYQEQSWLLRFLNRFLHFGVVAPLALVGLILTANRWRRLWILYGVVLLMSASVILFFILARYRQPMVPVLVLFAGAGVTGLLRKGALRRPIIWLALFAGAVFAVWSNQPFPYEKTQRAIGYYSVGSALADAGLEEEALPILREALRSEPNLGAAHKDAAKALMRLGRDREAKGSIEQAIRIKPDDIDALSTLGGLLFAEGEYREAASVYARGLAVDPEHPALLSNLGGCLVNQHLYEEAIPVLEKSIEVGPLSSPAHLNLGLAYMRTHRFDQAETQLDKAVRIDPRNAGAFLVRGMLRQEQGRMTDAEADYRQALMLQPNLSEARNRLRALRGIDR
jgi:tetratricopeptide (TPR) repeat protein